MSKISIKIKKVQIQNFRIYKDETFDFSDDFILLSGSNGFGKTTLIDAIEWCLTGSIYRLKQIYNQRNSNSTEKNRGENFRGIIKNVYCTSEDEIKVILIVSIIDTTTSTEVVAKISRKQKSEKLIDDTDLECDFVDQNIDKDKYIRMIKNINEDNSFYQYYTCDLHKTYNFLTKNRQDVKNEFDDFFINMNEQKNLAHNLALVNEFFTNKRKDLSEQKNKKENEIKEKKELLDSIKIESEQLNYPETKLFENENTDILSADIKKISEQYESIKNYGFCSLKFFLEKLVDNIKNSNKLIKFQEINQLYHSKKDSINKALANKLFEDKTLSNLLDDLNKYRNIYKSITNNNLADYESDVINCDNENFTVDYIKGEKQKILSLNTGIIDLENVINNLEKGNKLIKVLSDIVAGKNELFEYHKEHNKCPLCGSSETFKNIYKDDIAVEAQNYLIDQDNNIVIYKAEKSSKEKEILEIKNNILAKAKVALKDYIDDKENTYNELKLINDNTTDFFVKLKDLGIAANSSIKFEFDNTILDYEKAVLNKELKTKYEDLVNKLNILLEVNKNNDNTVISFEQQFINVDNYIKEHYKINEEFDLGVFNTKLIILRNMINNEKIKNINTEIKELEKNTEELQNKIEEQNNLIELCRTKISRINNNINKLEANELKNVGKYLYSIFQSISKHTKYKGFKFVRDRAAEGGVTVKDQETDGNILNLLSEGQSGVFIVSLFFANAYRRKNETNFRIYFVDDITSCMDDMNDLGFIDFIKYQMGSKNGVFDQFFFSTCDNSIERLIKYKMNTYGIPITNYKFDIEGPKIVED